MQTVLRTAQLAAEACRSELTFSARCQHIAMSWLILGLCACTICSPKVLQQLLAVLAASIAVHSYFNEYAVETQHVKTCLVIKSSSLHFDNTMFCCCLTYVHRKFPAIYTARS